MSLLSEVIATAEEGPDKKDNPIVAVLNINVKGQSQRLEIKKHSNHEKLGRDFIKRHHIGEKSLDAIVAKIQSMAEEGKSLSAATHRICVAVLLYACKCIFITHDVPLHSQ
jgi:hypothetical protein